MANKTLKDMYPDVSLTDNKEQQEASATKAANKAASELLNILETSESSNRDRRVVVRVDAKTFTQLNVICNRKGLSMSPVVRTLITDYIRNNKDLLE